MFDSKEISHANQYCLNCSRSYVIDEDDELYCPFRGSTPIQNDGWCKEWENDEKLNEFLILDFV